MKEDFLKPDRAAYQVKEITAGIHQHLADRAAIGKLQRRLRYWNGKCGHDG